MCPSPGCVESSASHSAMLFSEEALGSSLSGATDRVVFTLSLPLPADADEADSFESPKTRHRACTETLGAMAWGYQVLRAAQTDDGFRAAGQPRSNGD